MTLPVHTAAAQLRAVGSTSGWSLTASVVGLNDTTLRRLTLLSVAPPMTKIVEPVAMAAVHRRTEGSVLGTSTTPVAGSYRTIWLLSAVLTLLIRPPKA